MSLTGQKPPVVPSWHHQVQRHHPELRKPLSSPHCWHFPKRPRGDSFQTLYWFEQAGLPRGMGPKQGISQQHNGNTISTCLHIYAHVCHCQHECSQQKVDMTIWMWFKAISAVALIRIATKTGRFIIIGREGHPGRYCSLIKLHLYFFS